MHFSAFELSSLALDLQVQQYPCTFRKEAGVQLFAARLQRQISFVILQTVLIYVQVGRKFAGLM
jgi:hypothetical protein